jgi:hypothetical protein
MVIKKIQILELRLLVEFISETVIVIGSSQLNKFKEKN